VGKLPELGKKLSKQSDQSRIVKHGSGILLEEFSDFLGVVVK
jgi:hypothetical protein